MTPKKYTLKEQEPKIEFVTRVVTSEDRPMTAQEVFDCIDLKSMPHATRQKIHANLSDASGTYQLIGKSRMMSNIGKKRVHYHPRGMVVSGEDIPVPAYSKTGGNTFVNEDKPDAVKVAEKVLADLGADDDDDGLRTLLTNEPIPRTDDEDPYILQVLAQYHMTTIEIVKKQLSKCITSARATPENRALFDILKEMMS